jgi:short-subunit dehydrogenase
MIGSTAGQVVTPFLGAYSASKFAVEAISDALRQELRPWRVPVVIIEPGSFKSQNRASTETVLQADRASMSKDAEHRYGQALDAFIQFSWNIEARAGDPDRVAAVVERALTTSRPRARYLVGTDARTIVTLSRFLPARAMDAVLSRAVGMPLSQLSSDRGRESRIASASSLIVRTTSAAGRTASTKDAD